MKTIFKIGDKVIINPKKVYSILKSNPKWTLTNEIFTITQISREVDNNDNQIVYINKVLSMGSDKITSSYLDNIKECRKLKIQKINEKRR
jgi:hypothetical protein